MDYGPPLSAAYIQNIDFQQESVNDDRGIQKQYFSKSRDRK